MRETIPDDDSFWELAIGDPGPVALFDFPVYGRGAMTLQALRNEVGDKTFFKILKEWARTQAGGNVSTAEFIALSEKLSHKQLDALFDAWLSSGKPAGLTSGLAALRHSAAVPEAVRPACGRAARGPVGPCAGPASSERRGSGVRCRAPYAALRAGDALLPAARGAWRPAPAAC